MAVGFIGDHNRVEARDGVALGWDLEGSVLRLHRLIGLFIQTLVGLTEKVLREQKDAGMLQLLCIVFILVSRIIHCVFGKVFQLFAREGGASI